MSLFSVAHDVTISSFELIATLQKQVNGLLNEKWVLILTKLNQLKQSSSVEVKNIYPSITFNDNPHTSITFNNNPFSLLLKRHLGLVLDSKLTFNEHIKHILSKVNKSTGLLRKYQK